MWEQKLFEFFITIIPQSFALILLFFSLLGIKIELKSFALFSIGIAVIPYFIRPFVNFGVHSVITMFVLVLIAVMWAKSNIISSIMFSIISFAVAYISEWATFLLLEVTNFNMELLNTDAQVRSIIGIIPLIILFTVALTVYYVKKNIKKKEEF